MRRASPTFARATASAASSVPAARSESSAAASSRATWWARSRDGEPQQHPAVLHPQRVQGLGVRAAVGHRFRVGSGRRRPHRAAPPRMAYAGGRVDPSVGSVSSCQCSGCRRGGRRAPGWRRARRAAASRCPRRRRPPASSTSRSSTASASRTRASSAMSGSARRGASSGASGLATSPSSASCFCRALGVGEAEPDQVARRSSAASVPPCEPIGRISSDDRQHPVALERRRPGRGTPPTPAACCAGRSRRRARPSVSASSSESSAIPIAS